MFKDWFDVFFKPENFRNYKKEASVGKAVLNILVASAIAGVIWAIILALVGSFLGSFFGMAGLAAGGVTGAALGGIVFAYWIISGVLGLIIGSAILLLFAKLFKGEGDYATQTYYISLYSSALILVVGVIGWIPILGGLISLIACIWALYPLTIALRETHNYSTGKAVATWIIPAIIAFIIWVIVSAVWIASVKTMAPTIG